MKRDYQKDNMKCDDKEKDKHRLFKMDNSSAQESKCREKCSDDPNCIAMSGVWGEWCIGCNVALSTVHKGAIAFAKGKQFTVLYLIGSRQ